MNACARVPTCLRGGDERRCRRASRPRFPVAIPQAQRSAKWLCFDQEQAHPSASPGAHYREYASVCGQSGGSSTLRGHFNAWSRMLFFSMTSGKLYVPYCTTLLMPWSSNSTTPTTAVATSASKKGFCFAVRAVLACFTLRVCTNIIRACTAVDWSVGKKRLCGARCALTPPHIIFPTCSWNGSNTVASG